MAHWQAFFKGSYITGAEFGTRTLIATIANVKSVALEGDDGRIKDRAIVTFSDLDRGWVLCKTNAMCLAAMFGDDTKGWVGKRVTLFSMDVQVGPEMKPGIRVRGSPDISKPITVKIKLPKKKAFTMPLQPTKDMSGAARVDQPERAPDPPKPSPTPEPQPAPQARPLPPNASTAPTGNASDAANLMDKLRDFTW